MEGRIMLDEIKIERIKIDARENHVPILQDDSLQFIETLLEIKKPTSILEVGTAVGYSALQFSKHLKIGGKIITMELNEETANIAKKNENYVDISKMISKRFEDLMTNEKSPQEEIEELKADLSRYRKENRILKERCESYEDRIEHFAIERERLSRDIILRLMFFVELGTMPTRKKRYSIR